MIVLQHPLLASIVALAIVASLAPVVAGDSSQANVGNSAPGVPDASLPSSTMSPTAGTGTSLTVTVLVTDANGYNDVQSVTVELINPDGTTHTAAGAATFQSGNGAQATYTRTVSLNYYDAPTSGSETYKVKAVATDAAGATGDNTGSLRTFQYAKLAALSLGSASVSLGSLQPGATSSVVTLSVANAGNVRIDAQMSGGALTLQGGSATIPVTNLAYSTASDMSGSAALSGSAATLGAFDLAKGAGSSKSLYMRLSVPTGSQQDIPAGVYTGSLTVGAVEG